MATNGSGTGDNGQVRSSSPEEIIGGLYALIAAVRAGAFPAEKSKQAVTRLVDALTTLREFRDELADWEPELITAARTAGASWTALAPALGVTSRQAAERRYLRTRPTGNGEATKEARVQATRDQRAGNRAVATWARQNSAELRQLAGQVTGLSDLTTAGRRDANLIHAELGGDDTATLLGPLSTMRAHLTDDHADLSARIVALAADADHQRQDAVSKRHADGPNNAHSTEDETE